MRSRRDWQTELQSGVRPAALIFLLFGTAGLAFLLSAEREQFDPGAIDSKVDTPVQRNAANDSADAVVTQQSNLNRIFAVGGEVMSEHRSAARAEGQIFVH